MYVVRGKKQNNNLLDFAQEVTYITAGDMLEDLLKELNLTPAAGAVPAVWSRSAIVQLPGH